MKSIGSKIKALLFFDKDLVALVKEIHVSKEELYNHLTNGKIPMQEFISLV